MYVGGKHKTSPKANDLNNCKEKVGESRKRICKILFMGSGGSPGV
jgi:hypothetical protein